MGHVPQGDRVPAISAVQSLESITWTKFAATYSIQPHSQCRRKPRGADAPFKVLAELNLKPRPQRRT